VFFVQFHCHRITAKQLKLIVRVDGEERGQCSLVGIRCSTTHRDHGRLTLCCISGKSVSHISHGCNNQISASDNAILANYKKHIDSATRSIPGWVKVAVALSLGLGTMIGWKRIVVTVGEKIGKDHLTYAQGAAAEITAMFTIGAADWFGLPVSTTHVLSSGIAGTMSANHSGVAKGERCAIF
jgi:phosphate/sulfate permease